MMRGLVFGLLLLATPAAAGKVGELAWEPLNAGQVAAFLTAVEVQYAKGQVQRFGADGITEYDGTLGRWRVEGDQYCSSWPPSETWACYSVEISRHYSRVRFVGSSGDETQGAFTVIPDVPASQ